MLHPSYSDLTEALLAQKNIEENVISRYTIVIAAAKRARMLIDKSPSLVAGGNPDKAVSTAVKEMFEGYIGIRPCDPGEENIRDVSQLISEE